MSEVVYYYACTPAKNTGRDSNVKSKFNRLQTLKSFLDSEQKLFEPSHVHQRELCALLHQ
jgi:hypothetical protein